MSEGYRLNRLFATGGMAEVYLGTAVGAEGFERPVAIKRLLPHLARDPRIAQMFAAEAKLASLLQHQNIVQVLTVGRAGDELYIVMELVNGWDLGVLIGQSRRLSRPFAPHLAAYVAAQVNLALVHAYQHTHQGRPIIAAHRDVSPSNVLVSTEGEVKVADFGIARIETSAQRTEPGAFKGKLAYAAPEVILGERAAQASDQFALGVILYEMLAARHPFGDHGEDVLAYTRTIPTTEPARLETLPPLLWEILARMLAKRPEARFQTAEACGRALAEFLSRTGKPATPIDLAAFVRSLEPPPPPLAAHARDTVVSQLGGIFDLKPVPAAPPSQEGSFRPHGPAMDADGRLVGGAAAAATADPPASAQSPDEPGPSRAPRAAERSGMREIQLAEAGPDNLDLDLAERFMPRPPAEPPPEAAAAESSGAGRRLARTASRLARAAVLLGVVAAIGVGGWFGVKRLAALWSPKARPPAIAVTFVSEPAGARVIVGGEVLGLTPLSLDNDWPEGPIPVRIEKSGYRPWTGTFDGATPTSVNAALRK